MLLTGTFERNLDDKFRLAIPKRIREIVCDKENKGVLFLTQGTDGSLALYPESSFTELSNQLSSASPNGRDTRAFSRMFFAQAERLEIDRQGRVRIPPELTKVAGIEKDVVLLGVRDHIEIWDKARWEEYLANQHSNYDEIAERAFEVNTPNQNPTQIKPQETPSQPR